MFWTVLLYKVIAEPEDPGATLGVLTGKFCLSSFRDSLFGEVGFGLYDYLPYRIILLTC